MRVYFSTCRFVGFCCPVIQVHLMPCPSAGPKLFWYGPNIFWLDPKVEKSFLCASIFRYVDLSVFVVPPFKHIQLMPCPFVEPKLFWVSPIFFGWTQIWKKSSMCVIFWSIPKIFGPGKKSNFFFGPIEGWGMNDWCLSIGGKHEWSWLRFNTMVKI